MEFEIKKKRSLKVLFQVWWQIPHSYSIVSALQLVHLHKRYAIGPSPEIDMYVEEMPYFQAHWNDKKKLVYTEEYNQILRNFKPRSACVGNFDLIYRQTYPYNITTPNDLASVPKCVFYTSEFRDFLNQDYFTVNADLPKTNEHITEFLRETSNIYFTSPSDWSSKGLLRYNIPDYRNRIITHGVDSTIFYKQSDTRRRDIVRKMYNISDTDILLISTGAMTENKGIVLILQALHFLVNRFNKTNFKLLLKGTGDLYQSKQFLEIYFEKLVNAGVLNATEMELLYKNHIIFTDKTLSFSAINDLYNASDLMLSPYLAEGFGLTPLEALSTGLPVIVPVTGSTKEYMQDIYLNGGSDFIFYIKSEMIKHENGMCQNSIDMNDFIKTLLEHEHRFKEVRLDSDYKKMKAFIEENYSWNKVAELLRNYFMDIVSKV
jgi:glycosyltransferase involved in cell wall biosynthesis